MGATPHSSLLIPNWKKLLISIAHTHNSVRKNVYDNDTDSLKNLKIRNLLFRFFVHFVDI